MASSSPCCVQLLQLAESANRTHIDSNSPSPPQPTDAMPLPGARQPANASKIRLNRQTMQIRPAGSGVRAAKGDRRGHARTPVHARTCTPARTRTHVHACTPQRTHMYAHARIHTHARTCTHDLTRTHMHARTPTKVPFPTAAVVPRHWPKDQSIPGSPPGDPTHRNLRRDTLA
jgi:hypothetical protein